jgi:hypothetical protein
MIGIENTDHNALNPAFDDSIETGDFRMISGRAWLQSGEERCPGQSLFC